MSRWVLRSVLAAALLAPAVVAVAPGARAGVQPPGSCAFQATVAEGQLTPLAAAGSGPTSSASYLAQLSVVVEPPSYVPSNACVLDVSGTFDLYGTGPVQVTNPNPVSGTTTPCLGDPTRQSDYSIPGNGGCSSIGVLTLGSLQYGVFDFTGTVTAENDGVSAPLSCQGDFTGTSVFVDCSDPGQVHTL